MTRTPLDTTDPGRPNEGLRILVVDDDIVDRETVRRLLAKTDLHATVIEATDPLAALGVL
ncbi:MAG: response regulator [Deltaproteobacteria bacterium]|nr:response regulator [Deltaproteobacteria bacterium]